MLFIGRDNVKLSDLMIGRPFHKKSKHIGILGQLDILNQAVSEINSILSYHAL